MFVAHLPAGYLVSKLVHRRLDPLEISYPAFMLAGMGGALAPDLDLLWFYLIDGRQHNHHSYITHYPVFWLVGLAVAYAWFREADRRQPAALWCVFFLNGFLHMVLDSFVGDIRWLAPLSEQAYSLFHVSAVYKPWWLNFLLHWSIAFELAIVVAAGLLWRGKRRPLCAR